MCCIILSVLLVPVTYANSATATLSSSVTTLKVGESMTVQVSLQDVADVYGIQFELAFDSNMLKLISKKVSAGYSDFRDKDTSDSDAPMPTLYPMTRVNMGDKGFKRHLHLAEFTLEAQEEGSTTIGLSQLKAVSTETFVNDSGRNDLRVIPMESGAPIQITLVSNGNPSGGSGNPVGEQGSSALKPESSSLEALKEILNQLDALKAAKQLTSWIEALETQLTSSQMEEIKQMVTHSMNRFLDIPVHTTVKNQQTLLTIDTDTLKSSIQSVLLLQSAASKKDLHIEVQTFIQMTLKDSDQHPFLLTAEALQVLADAKLDVKLKSSGAVLLFPLKTLHKDKSSDILTTIIRKDAEDKTQNSATYRPAVVYELKVERIGTDGKEVISTFEEKVVLTIAYETKGLNKEKLGMYYLNEEKGEWEFLRDGRHDSLQNTFTMDVLHFSQYAVIEFSKDYADLSDTYAEAAHAIDVLSARHVVQGMGDIHYVPSKSMTRAEFTTMLAKVFRWKEAAHTNVFTDVPKGGWYTGYVEAALKAGVVQGDGEKFAPDEQITREQMLTMLMRAYAKVEALPEASSETFADDLQISDWAKSSIYQAKTLGFISGVGNNLVAPVQDTTRADMAVLMFNLLKRLEP
ncbi:S-layer homology domain-containing protein [Paenibacillus germinis]|nr:S-layer homology domain-containing protein [Paenibacillus germinis]